MRFLFPSGTYTLKFEGSGIDLSAVGKGSLKVTGNGPPRRRHDLASTAPSRPAAVGRTFAG